MDIINVQIHGHTFKIKTDASPEYVKRVVDYINKKISDTAAANPTMSFNNLVILSILEIADELFQLKEITQGSENLSMKTKSLIDNIDAKLSLLKTIIEDDTNSTE